MNGEHFYPIADNLGKEDREALGIKMGSAVRPSWSWGGMNGHVVGTDCFVKAVAVGEHRKPKKGEWYLSGAIVAAYRAPSDLDTEYHIARLVLTRIVVQEVRVETVIGGES